jgi:ribosomal-protein-alanine N-acetyltransferase
MITVREWTKEDIPILTKMEQACFTDPWTEEMLSDCLRYPIYNCFLAEEGGQVCGYCTLIVVCEDAEVGNIAVAPSYRGRGIAKLLMEKMHERAREKGATQAFLEVRVSNAPAISLYKKFGYEPYGIRARYYEDGEDALVMKRGL